MERKIYDDLLEWKQNKAHKPLIINGARQVGKSWILEEFGKKEYKDLVVLDCKVNSEVEKIASIDTNPERIIMAFRALTGKDIHSDDTLIIIDEIQEAPHMLSALKYFSNDDSNNQKPNYHIAAAGSLLGVSMHKGISFPVGKVNMLTMYPMDFEEYLWATGKDIIAEMLNEHDWQNLETLEEPLKRYLREYFFIGGMPEAVGTFIKTKSFNQVRLIQNEILAGYRKDFSKHIDSETEHRRIEAVWNSIPAQFAKEETRFQYTIISQKAKGREYSSAIQWLIDAGLLIKVPRINVMERPFGSYFDESIFKLYPLDCGLLGAMAGTTAKDVIIDDSYVSKYKGNFAEAYVLQQLTTQYHDETHEKDLIGYYKPNNAAEIDFCVESGKIIPIEVKSGRNTDANTFRNYISKHPDCEAYRISMNLYSKNGSVTDVPLYSVVQLGKHFKQLLVQSNEIEPDKELNEQQKKAIKAYKEYRKKSGKDLRHKK